MNKCIFITIPFIFLTFTSHAAEPPKKFSFEIKQEFDPVKNKSQYETLLSQAKASQLAFKENESMTAALTPICSRGYKLVKNMSKTLLNVDNVSLKSEYEIGYMPNTDFKSKLPTYNVDCIFFTEKSETMSKSVKIYYRESMNIDEYKGSYEFKVSIR